MAHTASARKRHRQSLERAARNKHVRSTVRNAVRRARQAAQTGAPDATEHLQRAERLLRKASAKGVFHPRTVSRTVSRLWHSARRAG